VAAGLHVERLARVRHRHPATGRQADRQVVGQRIGPHPDGHLGVHVQQGRSADSTPYTRAVNASRARSVTEYAPDGYTVDFLQLANTAAQQAAEK